MMATHRCRATSGRFARPIPERYQLGDRSHPKSPRCRVSHEICVNGSRAGGATRADVCHNPSIPARQGVSRNQRQSLIRYPPTHGPCEPGALRLHQGRSAARGAPSDVSRACAPDPSRSALPERGRHGTAAKPGQLFNYGGCPRRRGAKERSGSSQAVQVRSDAAGQSDVAPRTPQVGSLGRAR